MTSNESTEAGLGPNVVRLLLPHRQPLLMVDAVESWDLGETPRLVACRHISLNESVFDGHFPGFAIWPGIFTIEGLGQSCQLLATLLGLRKAWSEGGGDPDEPLRALQSLDRRHRLMARGEDSTDEVERLLQALSHAASKVGMSSLVQIKLQSPVFPGSKLTYDVSLTHAVGDIWRFEVAGFVGREAVARGQLGVSGNIPRIPA